jgi:hypothetical protein
LQKLVVFIAILVCVRRFCVNPNYMKTIVPFLAILLTSIFSFSTTAIAKIPQVAAIHEPIDGGSGCFVQYADGTLKRFSTLKLVTKMFKAPHLLADDSVVIIASELKAYQNEQGYAVAQSELGLNKKSFVAKNVLPGFAERVANGSINIYSVKFYNGQNTTQKLFMQDGNGTPIVPCTKQMLENALKDNIEALAVLSSLEKNMSDTKKILAAVEVFNQSKLISKN